MKNKISAKTITIVGPFATEYSLAKMNRNFAFALSKYNPDAKVQLWAEAAYVDRMPDKADLQRYPFLKDLITYEKPETDILIYNSFPKSIYAAYGFKDMPGKVKLAYLGWEESVFPKRWVDECNQYLHGLMVISDHVRQVFRASGITIPIKVVSIGLDIPLGKSENYPLKSKKKFKFFHESSGLYRKGVDVLLQAYLSEFSARDDVSLILKLFPNASMDKKIDELLASRNATSPEIEVIKSDNISDPQMLSLYNQSSACVQPSRAEGFGLPIAEAMALNKPIITTGYSGQMDFCNAANSFLIKYKLVDSASHLNIPGAKVAEPDLSDLKKQMRYVFENINAPVLKQKVAKAKQRANELTYENSAINASSFINLTTELAALKSKKIAVVSTLNSRCGIAEYSKAMYSSITSVFKDFRYFANSDIGDRTAIDSDKVERVWVYGEPDFASLFTALEKFQPDYIHFQYNLSFYSPLLLTTAIAFAKTKGIKTLVTLHSVHPSLQTSIVKLNEADVIFVHSADDLKSLADWGLQNGQLIEHGLVPFKDEDQAKLAKDFDVEGSPILASHGMIHDKKGLLELLAAVKILKKDFPNILLLAVNALNPNNSTSAAIFNKMQDFVTTNKLEKNVFFFTDFLKLPEVVKLLHLAQIVVMPYGDVVEGASGAVRTVIGANRPVITSDAYIFRNLPLGYKIKGNSPEAIAIGVKTLLEDKDLYQRIKTAINEYARSFDWEQVSWHYLQDLAETFKTPKS